MARICSTLDTVLTRSITYVVIAAQSASTHRRRRRWRVRNARIRDVEIEGTGSYAPRLRSPRPSYGPAFMRNDRAGGLVAFPPRARHRRRQAVCWAQSACARYYATQRLVQPAPVSSTRGRPRRSRLDAEVGDRAGNARPGSPLRGRRPRSTPVLARSGCPLSAAGSRRRHRPRARPACRRGRYYGD